MRVLKTFLADDSGATAIEYGLLAALMGLVIVGVTYGGAGGALEQFFTSTADKMANAG